MSRAARFKLYRALLIVAVVLIVPVIFVVGTSRLGKNGIFDMTHSFQRIAKDHDFIFHDQMFVQLNNPHLCSSMERNYRNRYLHKNYESQIVFLKY